MYGALKGKYDELEAIYKKYQYSFGDIYNKISDVKAQRHQSGQQGRKPYQ